MVDILASNQSYSRWCDELKGVLDKLYAIKNIYWILVWNKAVKIWKESGTNSMEAP